MGRRWFLLRRAVVVGSSGRGGGGDDEEKEEEEKSGSTPTSASVAQSTRFLPPILPGGTKATPVRILVRGAAAEAAASNQAKALDTDDAIGRASNSGNTSSICIITGRCCCLRRRTML